MAQIFTSNQVNHVLVATSLKEDNAKVVKTDAVGTISVQHDVEGNPYFMYKGYGGVVRSDLLTNIESVKYTPAPQMARKYNSALITINAAALNSGKVVVGQDYMLKLAFQNPIGISPDHKYWKYGAVHAGTNMTASDFYKKMAKSLAINLSRDGVQLLKIYLIKTSLASVNTTAQLVEVDANQNQTLSDTYFGIKLVEAPQEWILGVKQDKPLIFGVSSSPITNGNAEPYWADVIYSNGKMVTGGEEVSESITSTNVPSGGSIVNSHLAAELEYFAMGERADLYRNVGWPDVINTKYVVDPTNAYGYDMINIHYSYIGANHSIQKSEKDLTIIIPRVSTDNDTSTELGAIGALAASIKAPLEALINPADNRYLRISGAITDGNIPEFEGTAGVVVDSGKASSAIA
jgi:hypothetical protein